MTREFKAGPDSDINTGGTVNGVVQQGQLQPHYFIKQALIEARKEQYFTQVADAISMPKNMGKKIKRYHYLPLLDDANLNDQGIDAAGATIAITEYYVSFPDFITVTDATAAAAVTAINLNVNSPSNGQQNVATAGAGGSGGAGRTLISLNTTMAPNRVVKYLNLTNANAVAALGFGATVQRGSGNLYGSSKDIGLINGKMPVLSENGGRVNRVGFKRRELEGSLEKFGFFDEYTKESLDFDSDADLEQHVTREMVNGAAEMTEDALQIDLLTSASTIRWPGNATSRQTIDPAAAGANQGLVDYGDLMRLSIDLDNARTPKQTTMFTGTRMVDTRVIPGARPLYIGSELLPTIKAMKDLHNNPAFISIEKYAAGGATMMGEVGAVDNWRIIVVPEMTKWAGAGAYGSDPLYYRTNGRYDVFPMLAIGEGAFTTISFQTDGKSTKFTIHNKKPGLETADRTDPYGETGFMSIKWYYGFMILRSERLGLIMTAALL
jgi:N4-gp56 family major capsid protein